MRIERFSQIMVKFSQTCTDGPEQVSHTLKYVYICLRNHISAMRISDIKILLILLSVLSAVQVPVNAQNLYFDRIDIKNGLSQNTVSEIIQDSRGFMWFGTKDGLNRYDGTHFKVFRHVPGSGAGLGNNNIRTLIEDDSNRIWIGTNSGLYVYDMEYDRFSEIPVFDVGGGRSYSPVLALEKDLKGRIWISVEACGIYCHDPATGLTECRYGTRNPVSTMAVDVRTGTVWFSWAAAGLYYTDDDFNTVRPFLLDNGKKVFPEDVITFIEADDYDCLYLGFEKNGVMELDRNTGAIRSIRLSDEPLFVRQILRYSPEELWVGTETGLYIYNTRTGTHQHLVHSPYDRYSLSDNAIHSICKDRDGGIWLGTFFGGIDYLPERIPDFRKYYSTGTPGSLGGMRVGEICSDGKGELWVGTEDAGLYRFSPKTGSFEFFGPSAEFSNIQSLLLDGDDLWVSTFSNGIRVIDTATGKVRKYEFVKTPGPRLFSNNVFALEQGCDGRIWIGTMHGLQYYNRETDDFGFVPQINGGMMVNDIFSDSDGNLWVGTLSNGLFMQDASDRRWTQFLHIPSDTSSIPINNVLSIFEDNTGQLWITTDGGGFSRYDAKSRTFKTFTTADGMPSDVVYRIVEDDSGKFWISTSNGLVRFNPLRGKVLRVYTSGDGLLCNQFNYGSGYKSEDGRIFFGSIEGLISFNPESLMRDNADKNPPVFFTGFSIQDEDVAVGGKDSPLQKDISFTESIELNYARNGFSIEMAVLEYRADPQIWFMLEGVDSRWRSYKGNSVNYSNLAPGHYTFLAKSRYTGSTVKTLDIRILPPWYGSTTAISAYLILLTLSLIAGVNIYHRRAVLKRKKYIMAYERKKEKEVYDSKIAFFTSITHEIRTPLTLIKGPLDNILAKDRLDPRIARDLNIMSRNTDRLLVLVNQLLDFQKIEKQNLSLDLTKQNVASILEEVYSRFSTSISQQHKDCSIDIRDRDLYALVDAEAFTKIISNMLSNAMKYSDSRIRISLCRSGESFCLSVSNDGELISPDKREAIFAPFFRGTSVSDKTGTGIGLYLARSLAELQHGTLTMGPDTGENEFVLKMPLCPDSEKDDVEEDRTGQVEEALQELSAEKDDVAGSRGEIILVVEDDMEMCDFIRDQVSEKWSVLVAHNGKEALKVLEKNYVTLIVSDIMMPEMDGMELCRRVKTDPRYSHISFILLTAKTSLESKITGMNSGADMYIEKPYSKSYLMAVITNQIKSRQALREAFLNNPLATMDTEGLNSSDTEFIRTLQEVIQENLSNSELKIDDIVRQMHTSRANLYRKISGVLNMSPMDYLRVERLKQAARMLAENKYQISEVCYMVGFNSPTYFTKCFQKQFGVLPKDFIKTLSEGQENPEESGDGSEGGEEKTENTDKQ